MSGLRWLSPSLEAISVAEITLSAFSGIKRNLEVLLFC